MSESDDKGGGQEKAGGGGFTVTDRRIFADDKGTARVEEAPAGARPAPVAAVQTAPSGP